MLKKRPIVALLNNADIVASGANLHEDSTAKQWSVILNPSGAIETLLGPFPYGKIRSVIKTDPAAEVRQIVLIGASTSKETIAASTRYRIEIGNPDQDYETRRSIPAVHAYTSAAVLTGNSSTDRANVYTALISKINSYGGNNATAYPLSYIAFTGGTSSGDTSANFVVGEVVKQADSNITAKVAKCTITSGAMASDDAAGHLWLYDISNVATWDINTNRTWTAVAAAYVAGVSSNCVVTGTAASTIHSTGIAIVDNARYFTSHINRGGVNYVAVTQGFSVDVPEIARTAVYSQGIGTDMLSLMPVYDYSKQNLIRGKLEYDFQNGMLPISGITYNKYLITLEDGPDDVSGINEHGYKEVILYADAAATYIADLNTNLTDGSLL